LKHLNDRSPNFTSLEGKFFLVRCYNCDKDNGRENSTIAVASGVCAFCGWSEKSNEIMNKLRK
jgi:hypothetical protein